MSLLTFSRYRQHRQHSTYTFENFHQQIFDNWALTNGYEEAEPRVCAWKEGPMSCRAVQQCELLSYHAAADLTITSACTLNTISSHVHLYQPTRHASVRLMFPGPPFLNNTWAWHARGSSDRCNWLRLARRELNRYLHRWWILWNQE